MTISSFVKFHAYKRKVKYTIEFDDKNTIHRTNQLLFWYGEWARASEKT